MLMYTTQLLMSHFKQKYCNFSDKFITKYICKNIHSFTKFKVDGLSLVLHILFYFFKMIFIFYIIAGLQCSVNFLLNSKVTQSHIYFFLT